MKYIVALTVIASVAAGSLRASTNDDNAPAVKAFIEMKKESPTTQSRRKLQMGIETTRVGETSVMMEQKTEEADQGQSQLFNRFRQRTPTVTRGSSTPATELHMKDKTEVLPDAEDTEDFDVRIVGGEVSDSNEFPYFGTSLHLPVTHK